MNRGTTFGVYLKAISSSGSLLLLLLLHFQKEISIGASAASVAAIEEKCDKVVSVGTVELLSYLGNVTFPVPSPYSGKWTALIKFTSPYMFIGGWGVEVQSFGNKAYAIFTKNDEVRLKAGDLVIFQFRVLHGINKKVPKVHSILWENIPICGPSSGRSSFIHQPLFRQTRPILFDPESSEEQDTEENTPQQEESADDVASEREAETYTIHHHIASNNVRLENWKESTVKN